MQHTLQDTYLYNPIYSGVVLATQLHAWLTHCRASPHPPTPHYP